MVCISAPASEISAIGREPQRDAIVEIVPDWLGAGSITLRCPEIIYSRSARDTYYIDHIAGGGFVALRDRYVHVPPRWTAEDGGRTLHYDVTVPGKCSFRAKLTAGPDYVAIVWSFRNESAQEIPDLMVQFCPCTDRAPDLDDPRGERVFLPRGDDFLRMADADSPVGTPVLHHPTDDPRDDAICLEALDGRHVVGIGWDVRPQHFLHNTALSCIHTEPHVEPLAPGAEWTARGTFYCMEGGRRDLVARYREEWR